MIKGLNPVLKGFHPDPVVCKVGKDYYIATSTFQWFPGVELYHSRDLVNWEQLPSPLNRVSQLDMRGNPNSGGIWAPCLTYSDGTYYLVYTNTKNFHGIFKDVHNYVVTAKNPCGPWSEPTYLNSSGFDPSMFHDEDGRKYLLNMRWDHRMEKESFESILIQEYSEKEKKLIGEPKIIYTGSIYGATEAPHMFKKNGYYYLVVAEGGTMYNHGVRLARSKSVFGPFEADESPIITARDNKESPLQRTGHGSIFETDGGQVFMAYLCGRPISEKRRCILGRETCIAELIWTKDGWLRLKNGGVVPPLEYRVNLQEVKVSTPPEHEEFDFSILPPHYKTLRNPLSMMGSLNARRGYLRLFGNESITSLNNQSMVARRLDAFKTETTVEMEFSPKDFQTMAGISAFYDTYNFFYLYLSRNEGGFNELRIIVRDGLKFYDPIMTGVSVGEATHLWLRVNIDNLKLQFSYSLNGCDFEKIGNELNCSNLSDEAYESIGHEGHTGTFLAMCTQDLSSKSQASYADFKSITYKRLK